MQSTTSNVLTQALYNQTIAEISGLMVRLGPSSPVTPELKKAMGAFIDAYAPASAASRPAAAAATAATSGATAARTTRSRTTTTRTRARTGAGARTATRTTAARKPPAVGAGSQDYIDRNNKRLATRAALEAAIAAGVFPKGTLIGAMKKAELTKFENWRREQPAARRAA
jgi:hypothetical protein